MKIVLCYMRLTLPAAQLTVVSHQQRGLRNQALCAAKVIMNHDSWPLVQEMLQPQSSPSLALRA